MTLFTALTPAANGDRRFNSRSRRRRYSHSHRYYWK